MICYIIQNKKPDQHGRKPTLLHVPDTYIVRVNYDKEHLTIELDTQHPSFFERGGKGIANYKVAESMLNNDLSQVNKSIIRKVDLSRWEIEALRRDAYGASWPDTNH